MKKLLLSLLLLAILQSGYSQVVYQRKAESGFLFYQYETIQVDPGPDWKGYPLNNEENGVDVNLVYGISIKNQFVPALGVGYSNFEGINGVSIFADFDYLPFQTRLTPLINLKLGYNHIWNQYENGNGSALGELNAGVCWRIDNQTGISLRAGLLLMQQALFIPVRVRFRF